MFKIDIGGKTQTKWTILFSLGIFVIMGLQTWKMGKIQPELFDFAKWLWGGLVIRNTAEGVVNGIRKRRHDSTAII